MRNLKIYKSAIPIVLGASLVLTGCNKKMDCQVEGEHAHKYVTESGFETYRNSEYEHLGNLTWTDTTKENTDEINALTNFNLIRIDENEKIIEENTKSDLPYIEYEYKYHYTTPVMIGKVWTHIPHTGYRFTTDKTHNNLTGNVRDVTYKYQAYKLVVNVGVIPTVCPSFSTSPVSLSIVTSYFFISTVIVVSSSLITGSYSFKLFFTFSLNFSESKLPLFLYDPKASTCTSSTTCCLSVSSFACAALFIIPFSPLIAAIDIPANIIIIIIVTTNATSVTPFLFFISFNIFSSPLIL